MEKNSAFTNEIKSDLSNFCKYDIPANHIADERMVCDSEFSSRVIFQARIILTEGRNISELKENLTKWVSTSPRLVILGVQLEVDKTCSVIIVDFGDTECTETTTSMMNINTVAITASIVPGLCIIISCLVVLFFIIYCKKRRG